MSTKSKAAFDLVMAIDVETSGLAFGQPNPVTDTTTGEKFQTLSIGLVVASIDKLKPIDELYLEIQFDEGHYTWSDGAEKVHGMSREYLKENGLTRPAAVVAIVEFIEKYYGPAEKIKKLVLLGHNVGTFDKLFLEDLLASVGISIQFGNRHIDTFTLGVMAVDAFSSNELFDFFGLVRDPENHNALEDAKFALTSARLLKKFFHSL